MDLEGGLGITVMLHGGKFIDDDVGGVAQSPAPKHITFNKKQRVFLYL